MFKFPCLRFARCRADQRGNVIFIFALTSIVLFAVLGLAVDYGEAFVDKAKLDAAADAASMTAVETLESLLSSSRPSMTMQAAMTLAQSEATGAFYANASLLTDASVPALQVKISDQSETLTAAPSSAASVSTTFSRILGVRSLPLGAAAMTEARLTR